MRLFSLCKNYEVVSSFFYSEEVRFGRKDASPPPDVALGGLRYD